MRRYKHWETWAGLLLCGVCAGFGSYLGGKYFGHSSIVAGIGGGIGGLLFRGAIKHVDHRHHSESA